MAGIVNKTLVVCLTAILLTTARTAGAEDRLVAARELYTAAAYEDALARLNTLRTSARDQEEGRSIDQYRAYCLLALGRRDEAERAIGAVVTAAPFYRPSDADASPRVRLTFSEVRRRMLPGIIQQRYAEAKAAYDRGDFPWARDAFKQVLDLFADPELAPAAGEPPLADMRALAAGFRDLINTAATPVAVAPMISAPPPVAASVPQPTGPRIYGASDQGVVLPVVLRQSLDPLTGVFALRAGVIEIVISEIGLVEAAMMRTEVNPVYDRLALATAKSWRYRPATLDGVPVKFHTIVQLDLKAAW